MTVLYLVRHGETFDNERKVMQGITPGKLNDKGIEQAKVVAGELKGEPIDNFVSSDLHRSIETCRIIAAPHHKEIVTTQLLRERDWGSFTGQYIPSLAHLNDPSKWPVDIETLDELKKRAAMFLQWVRESYPEQRVLAVGHGIINKAIQSVYYKRPMNEIKVMANAEIRILEL